MKSLTLTKYGKAATAFELRETPTPKPAPNQVLVKVDAFGLNYADVMARNGLYRDAPPLPCILGYEAAGTVAETGSEIKNVSIGQRVLAFTRFGAYAEYVLTQGRAVVPIPDAMDNGIAVALATQYCTAYYAAYEMVNLHPGDHVLIHAAAGGVGIALVQLAKLKGCIVYGTAGSNEKINFLKSIGVDYPINYYTQDFVKEINNIQKEVLPSLMERGRGRGLDIVFDSLGGKIFSNSRKLLAYGGRIIGYGAAERSGKTGGVFADIKLLFGFGFFNAAFLLMSSRGIIGVNMLRIADHKPDVLQRCMENVVALSESGKINPHVGGRFKANEISKAHEFLENRKSIGKIVVEW